VRADERTSLQKSQAWESWLPCHSSRNAFICSPAWLLPSANDRAANVVRKTKSQCIGIRYPAVNCQIKKSSVLRACYSSGVEGTSVNCHPDLSVNGIDRSRLQCEKLVKILRHAGEHTSGIASKFGRYYIKRLARRAKRMRVGLPL
jgi:hypothetical protein